MITGEPISRFKAAAIHLMISAVIAGVVLAIMLALWYPPPLFDAMGGKELIALIVGIDVTMGPLITLIIFDTRKKELVFDLAIIAALQLAAMGYGVYAMHAGRPVFTVFTEHKLAVVSAAQIDADELAKARFVEFRHLSLTGPQLVAAVPPTDPKEINDIAFAGLAGFGIQQLPRYYEPYGEHRARVLTASRPLTALDLSPESAGRLRDYLARSGKKPEELRYLPVTTKNSLLLGVIDAGTGNLMDIIAIDPGRKP